MAIISLTNKTVEGSIAGSMVPLQRRSREEAKEFMNDLYDEKGKRRTKSLSEEKVAEKQEERRIALKKILLISGGAIALASIPPAAWFGWKTYEEHQEKKRIAQIFDNLASLKIPDMHVDAFPVEGASKIIVLIEASPYVRIPKGLEAANPQSDADIIRRICASLQEQGFPVHTVIGGCQTDGESSTDLGSVQCKNLNMATNGVGDLNHHYWRRLKRIEKHPFFAWDTLCDIANHGDLSLTSGEENLSPVVTVALDRNQTIRLSEKDKKGKEYFAVSYDLPKYLHEKGVSVVRFKPAEKIPEHIPDPKIIEGDPK